MQFLMSNKKQKLYSIAALGGALLCAGYIYLRASTKITSGECNKALQNPQSRTSGVPTEISSNECNKALQYSQSRTSRVPTDISIDECNKALQSSQSRASLDPRKMADDKWLQCTGLKILQSRKKLCLVLDLDHTLVHTKLVSDLSPHEAENCLSNISHQDDIYRWEFLGYDHLIKLRPFARKFLEEANKLFEIYIYTMGVRSYALHVTSLLDPDSTYLGSRIMSTEDCTIEGQKGLDFVLVDESGVLILDDTPKVWLRCLSNLIVIKRYRYFGSKGASTRLLSEEGTDESESAGSLSRALKLLQEVHNLYFGGHDMLDVRVLLGNLRGSAPQKFKI